MIASAGRNHWLENTGIQAAVNAKPAAAHGRTPVMSGLRRRSCQNPNSTSHRKIRPQIAKA